jgi:hypothetical protein
MSLLENSRPVFDSIMSHNNHGKHSQVSPPDHHHNNEVREQLAGDPMEVLT